MSPAEGLHFSALVKEVPETQEDMFIVPIGFIFLALQLLDGLPLPLTLLVRAILLLRTSFTMLQSNSLANYMQI